MKLEPVAEVLLGQLNSVNGPVLSPLFEDAYFTAEENGESVFTVANVDYRIDPWPEGHNNLYGAQYCNSFFECL